MSKTKKSDKLICEYCNHYYTRSNRAQHRKSKICQAFQKSLDILKNIMLSDTGKRKWSDLIARPYTDSNGKIIYLTHDQLNLRKQIGEIKKDQKYN